MRCNVSAALLLLLSAVQGPSTGLSAPSNNDVLGFPIYYINLDSRPDRRENMEKMLGAQPHARISATTTQGVQDMLANGTLVCKAKVVTAFSSRGEFKSARSSTFSLAEVATTHSHLSAIQRAYNNNDEMALVLEDDIELVRTKLEVLQLANPTHPLMSPHCPAFSHCPPPPPSALQAAAGRVPPQAAGHGWGPRPRSAGRVWQSGLLRGCGSPPKAPQARVQVRAGREDGPTRPPPSDGTGGNDPCSSDRACYQAPDVQVRGRWIDPSWWQPLKVHSDPWEAPDSPWGGSPPPSHFKPRSEVYTTLGSHRARHVASLPQGALDPWESSDLPCGDTPSQSRFSSEVRA